MDVTPLYQGSCLCGGVSFTMTVEPPEINSCFCIHCRKNAGGPCQINAMWSERNMTIHDREKLVNSFILTNTASGHPKIKCFCKVCGCTLWTIFERGDEVFRNVRVGLIEDGIERLRPLTEFFIKRRPPYVLPFEGARQLQEDEPDELE
ncbi:hypothetical protein DACRYDRAFT_76034 [Dacryopinax primogenitus]|uniref:CENP-V/GFA domain-containing protein n=1 Tax=Dacryopinax primogenitus (strain DJM 731) TaxID=1858805 RepID=M5G8C2_DACPD|nr:uncharacterized protein DACRYDRAFT_76034 [Dacryopinax primogenitus]EJU05009.1 hypothetical protein DACRYDRAFT_76034 [Dacryopinax primogenitus]